MTSDLLNRVFSAIERLEPEMVAALRNVIQIPSINPRCPGVDYERLVGGESLMASYMAGLYERAGCEIDLFGLEVGRDNCVGRVRGTGGGRSLIFNGHVDVVPPGPTADWIDGEPFSGRVADGRVHGRGATDMKGGLIALAFAAIGLQEAGVRLAGDLILEAVVGEETMEHILGTTACIERGYVADGAIVAESSAPPITLGVIPATPGLLSFKVTVEGKRTHPAMRGETIHAGGGGSAVGVNAIDKGFLMYEAFARREREWALTKHHPLFTPGQFGIQPALFVGSPRGQLDPGFIPDLATLDYLVIYHPDDDPAAVRTEIEELVADVAHLDGWLREHPPDVVWKHHWPPSVVPADHPLVAATRVAHERATGTPSQVRGWVAMHDGAFLNARGIAAICYGPGDIRVAHSPNESLRVDELVLAAKTYAALAIEWCGASPVTGG